MADSTQEPLWQLKEAGLYGNNGRRARGATAATVVGCQRAVWQCCSAEAAAPSLMEQLFGAWCARVLEHRVNRGEEQCKQNEKGEGGLDLCYHERGKHPRELNGGVVNTGMHKHHYIAALGRNEGAGVHCETTITPTTVHTQVNDVFFLTGYRITSSYLMEL